MTLQKRKDIRKLLRSLEFAGEIEVYFCENEECDYLSFSKDNNKHEFLSRFGKEHKINKNIFVIK